MQKNSYNSEMVRARQKISVLEGQRRLQIYRVKNIGRVSELSGVAFRLVPPYGELLVVNDMNNSIRHMLLKFENDNTVIDPANDLPNNGAFGLT